MDLNIEKVLKETLSLDEMDAVSGGEMKPDFERYLKSLIAYGHRQNITKDQLVGILQQKFNEKSSELLLITKDFAPADLTKCIDFLSRNW